MIKIMFLIPNNIRNIILVVLLTKWLFFREEKTQPIHLLQQFLKKMIFQKNGEKHFNENLVMFVEDKRIFKSSNKC